MSADSFPQDVLELQGYLTGDTRVPGVQATPGKGTNVPLYILGSSLFGARLAAALGLPFAFASHFAPQALQDAASIYRREFRPSAQSEKPHFIAGVNVIASDTASDAHHEFHEAMLRRVTLLLGRGQTFTREESEAILASPGGQQMADMARYSAVGTPDVVRDYLERFAAQIGADELIVATQAGSTETWLRSFELLAGAMLPVTV
jgi:luciferase family oxidoreductase group 1